MKAPHHIFTRDHCDQRASILEKPIIKMSNNFKPHMGLHNTLILDDRNSTFENVNPQNGILIPRYNPNEFVDDLRKHDDALYKFQRWLLKPEVITCNDLRNLDKNNIFT